MATVEERVKKIIVEELGVNEDQVKARSQVRGRFGRGFARIRSS